MLLRSLKLYFALWSCTIGIASLQAAGNFSLSATPSSQTVKPGGSTSYTVTVTKSGGFNAAVSFTVSGLPAGAGATFNPTTVTGSGSTTMTVTTTTGTTPAANSTLTITGTSGSLVHTASVTLRVTDFTLSTPSPSSQTVTQGSTSGGYSISATALNSFTGTIIFSVTSGLPSGATALFTPSSLTNSGTTVLTIATSTSTPVGSPTLTITGTSGAWVHTTTATLIVQSIVATPTFSPAAGAYASPQSVTISTTTSGASIRYTTDGSTPTSTVGTLYSTPVSVSSSATIKAIAYKAGMSDSAVASATYTISPTVAAPTFSPSAGTYTSTQSVTISTTTSGASIRYTTNGSTPSSTVGTVYSGAITVSATATINAIAYATGMADSAVATAAYSIVPPPSITNVTPTSGSAGAQVTVTGSNFGPTAGSGGVWIGSTFGVVLSWTDTQIVASVASNSTTGTVQVRQSAAWSNSVPFTVPVAAITSVSPTNGVPGTVVTITGSRFGSTQGSGQVWLGTANGIVQSWSDTQVVAVIAGGSVSGKAQVLQGGVWSNPVAFAVSTPRISGISPSSGSPGTSVTISGTGFGASQGTGTVLLGSTAGQVTTWSDTQIVASVVAGSVTGVARVQQGAILSNSPGFTVPSTGPSMALVPAMLNLEIGETHTIQARGSSGQSITGLTWNSSDSNIVSLSSTDPPILAAVAAGRVTITAGTASADVTVSSTALPVGTAIWSSPGSFSRVIPAVPSATGVADVFALQNDGTVQAITSEGTTAWTADVSQAFGWVVPDFQGGLIVMPWDGAQHIRKLDGLTGQPYPAYTLANPDDSELESVAVHTDGTIFAHINNRGPSGFFSKVIGIDPLTAVEKFSITLPNPSSAPDIIVAGDGFAYMAYAYQETSVAAGHLKVLKVDSNGASSQIDVFDWTGPYSGLFPFVGQSALISNGADGVRLSWWDQHGTGAPVPHWTAITSSGVSDGNGPVIAGQQQVPISPVLSREDGSFIGLAMVGDRFASFNQLVPYIVAFDPSGGVVWTVANDEPQVANADGGVIGKSGIVYNAFGIAAGQINLATTSWLGNVYGIGSVEQLAASPVLFSVSFWPFQDANQSRNRTAPPPRDSKANDTVKKKLTPSFWQRFSTSHCSAVLGNSIGMPSMVANYSLAGVQQKQGMTNFYDVGNPGVGDLQLQQVTLRQFGSNIKLSDRLGNNNAVTDNGGFSRQTATILKTGILSGSNPQFLLVHEIVFHAFAGLTDDQVFGNAYFQSQGLWRQSGSSATTPLTNWLSTDCRCTPGNPQAPTCQANTANW